MILRFMELSCDGCNDAVVGPVSLHEGVREVRKIAKAQGWIYHDRQDLCPRCAEQDAVAVLDALNGAADG